MSIRWKIYCTESGDEGWKSVWSDTEPTTCPNDEAHSINVDSVVMDTREVEVIRLTNLRKTIRKSMFERIVVCQYRPHILGTLRRVCIVVSIEPGTTTEYELELLNITGRYVISTKVITDMNQDVLIDLGVVSNPPTEECCIELNGKRNNGNSIITINEIVFYAEEINE